MKKLIACISFFLITTLAFSDDLMNIQIKNFRIDAPLGWFAQYTETPVLFFLYSPIEENDTFQENCNLTVEKLSGKMSLESYINASIDSISKVYTNFKLIEKKDNTILITGEMNGNNLEQLMYFYMNGNDALVLTFTSNPENFEEYATVFHNIAATFKYK